AVEDHLRDPARARGGRSRHLRREEPLSQVGFALPPCTRCSTPLEEGDLRCSVCALPVPAAGASVEKAQTKILRCTECGAAIAFDANKHAPACGFCGATMKVEQPVDPIEVAQLQVPFAVGRDDAESAIRTW